MLTITDVGSFACDYCRTEKRKSGVEVAALGLASRGTRQPADPSSNTATINIRLYVWREPLFLCQQHLETFLAELRDDVILSEAYKKAATDPGYVNTTLEQAQELGLTD